jgi:hypothetical protein
MPISLLNCIVKIITQLLGERLQTVIIPLVHQNQYGFIKSRTIQDCLAWPFEYIHQCQQSKQKIVIIKLDFTKAFDTIEHNSIILMMKHLGFNDKWTNWVSNILSSATTSILLNGVPGKNLICKRGVRQGSQCLPSCLSWQQTYFNVSSIKLIIWGFSSSQSLQKIRPVFL